MVTKYVRPILVEEPMYNNIVFGVSEWVSEWVSDYCLNTKSAIVQQEQVNLQWDDDEVGFVLEQHAELDFYSSSSLK